jgi:ketosteroid isomerase-like protein
MAPDLEVIPPGEQPLAGADAHDFYGDLFDNFTTFLKPTDIEVVVSGDWAFRRYAYELSLTPKAGGETLIMRGHGIHMFKRQADGSWRVTKDIYNTLPSE